MLVPMPCMIRDYETDYELEKTKEALDVWQEAFIELRQEIGRIQFESGWDSKSIFYRNCEVSLQHLLSFAKKLEKKCENIDDF